MQHVLGRRHALGGSEDGFSVGLLHIIILL